MITVSTKAKEYISKLIQKEQKDAATFVRVGVKTGGCSGLEYQLQFDAEKKAGDEVFEHNGITVVVERRSLLYLFGTERITPDGLHGKGLFFNNPNASRTCSCGESFAV